MSNLPCSPDIFSDDQDVRRLAKGPCFQCPIRMECMSMGVKSKARHGVWGGFDLSSARSRRRAAQIVQLTLG